MEKLAIEGGTPIRKAPLPERIMFDRREVEAVVALMEAGTKRATGGVLDRYAGTMVEEYEREFARFFGRPFATAVSSGTAAVHAAVAALDLEPGDEVVTSPITDPGTVMPILFQGLIPVFADVDYRTLNITAGTIEAVLTKRTRAVIPVHLAGVPCEMEPIMRLARKKKLAVIEDVAQAHGSVYQGKYAGSFGDLAAFSLMSGKHMTSGGQGGMVLSRTEKLHLAAKRFADRGKPFGVKNAAGNPSIGLNYRMTQLEAVVGRIQLKKLKKIAAARFRLVEKLRKKMEKLTAVRLADRPADSRPDYWFCFVRVDTSRLTVDKARFAAAMQAEGMPVGAHYVIPMYENPFIRDRKTFGASGYPWNPYRPDIVYRCPEAERALADHMTLHLHECCGDEEVDQIHRAFEKVERRYLKS